MGLATAFGITEDDVQQVLEEYALRVTNTRGQSFEAMAGELIGDIDHERVAQAGLDAGTDMDAQTVAAHEEIKNILVEIGVMDF